MAKREPGERRKQILQTLAHMLENPKGERITTALLAAKLEVSEAALYRRLVRVSAVASWLLVGSAIFWFWLCDRRLLKLPDPEVYIAGAPQS